VIRVEFTVEPFVEGQPGPHVLAAVSAAETAGVTVEFGPFASEFEAEDHVAFAAVSALIEGAYAHGATHVNIHLEKVSA
jgi:uncharacterized protein YqgV (UPF0045/DUF77 family)